MDIKRGLEYDYDDCISYDEYAVIDKFLAYYKKQDIIVADEYREDYSVVPFNEIPIIVKTGEANLKSIYFYRRIYHNGKPYIVKLGLWRIGKMAEEPSSLELHEFNIITNDKVHIINFNTQNSYKYRYFNRIINIFDENKIVSPAQAHSKKMYTNVALQEFIQNHEWDNIDKGINQLPSLANALFIMGKGYSTCTHNMVDFGTILYQLIMFRQSHINDFDENDLRKLDELILKLRKTELLKVTLDEQITNAKSYPTSSILIEANNIAGRMHISEQYTVRNSGLDKERTELNKCIRRLKKQSKN